MTMHVHVKCKIHYIFTACEKLGLPYDEAYKFFTDDGCELMGTEELCDEEITQGKLLLFAKKYEAPETSGDKILVGARVAREDNNCPIGTEGLYVYLYLPHVTMVFYSN